MTPPGRQARPPSRRDWQQAIRAELACTPSAGDRASLLLGAVRVSLLPPAGLTCALAEYSRAAAFASLVTAAAWVPVGAALYLGNTLSQTQWVQLFGILMTGTYSIAVMVAADAAARRRRTRPTALAIGGFAAGLVILTTSVTFPALIGTASLSSVPVFAPAFGPVLAILRTAFSCGRFRNAQLLP